MCWMWTDCQLRILWFEVTAEFLTLSSFTHVNFDQDVDNVWSDGSAEENQQRCMVGTSLQDYDPCMILANLVSVFSDTKSSLWPRCWSVTRPKASHRGSHGGYQQHRHKVSINQGSKITGKGTRLFGITGFIWGGGGQSCCAWICNKSTDPQRKDPDNIVRQPRCAIQNKGNNCTRCPHHTSFTVVPETIAWDVKSGFSANLCSAVIFLEDTHLFQPKHMTDGPRKTSSQRLVNTTSRLFLFLWAH